MAPLRASTTKSEWLPDDPTAFVPTMLWKLPFITTWDGSRNQNHPTDSAEEAEKRTRRRRYDEESTSCGEVSGEGAVVAESYSQVMPPPLDSGSNSAVAYTTPAVHSFNDD